VPVTKGTAYGVEIYSLVKKHPGCLERRAKEANLILMEFRRRGEKYLGSGPCDEVVRSFWGAPRLMDLQETQVSREGGPETEVGGAGAGERGGTFYDLREVEEVIHLRRNHSVRG